MTTFFFWRVFHNKINNSKPSSCEYSSSKAYNCAMCNKELEDSNHFFFHLFESLENLEYDC